MFQRYRTHLKLGQTFSHETQTLRPPAVNEWLKKLDSLVRQAADVAEQCCIRLPTNNVISRYRMSLRIREIIASVEEHLKQVALIGITTMLASNEELGRGLQRIEQKLDDLGTAATSSNYPTATQRFQPVNEPLIVGQDDVFSKLREKLIDEGEGLTCLGVVAMGGAGKTLLLKTVFNSKEVQDSFKQDLVLWLTVSHNPSLSALARHLGRQIALQINQLFDEGGGQDDYVKRWIYEKMKSRRFLLFLDDDWENSSDGLLEPGGVGRAGCNGRHLQTGSERQGQKSFGKIRNKLNPDVENKLYNRLRLSYDALARYNPHLQLCYLYIGAFKEDEFMYVEDLINLWIGEGLVTTNRPGYDPLEIGRAQVNVLLDRCLIEGSVMDADGQVMVCSMHDVLHDLALQIAELEENCLYRAGKNLQLFPENECKGQSRISLMENNFASVPDSFEGGQVLSMLLSENKNLTIFSARAMATMTRVRVLDLGGTSIQELPSSFGRMKQLVCLRLARLPINKLPESITELNKLQILDLSTCNQLECLPSGIGKLVSLKYLDFCYCQRLQSLPSGISRLLSLQYLRSEGC
ncbi:disease resistance protein RFL1-like [Cryptomeria japonica]|uniref:disease resistance protein RFL1-like n=1 Tax=Cryptomeria japonica TaxID=3369 RepID=UPI0027DA52E7|nr:disease resistance protein RFL1-like [Cryptomeria japonica]